MGSSSESFRKERDVQVENLSMLLDGYFGKDGGHHLNVNVFSKEGLEEMLRNPENYPQATIRVSGYALELAKATKTNFRLAGTRCSWFILIKHNQVRGICL